MVTIFWCRSGHPLSSNSEGYSYFIEHGSHLVLTSCLRILFFLSKFQIPWILCWDFVLIQMIPFPFPMHLAKQFKVKWWSNFSPSNTQQLPAIRHWISGKNSTSTPSPSKDPSPIPVDFFFYPELFFLLIRSSSNISNF